MDGRKSIRSMEGLELKGDMTVLEWRMAKFGAANVLRDAFI